MEQQKFMNDDLTGGMELVSVIVPCYNSQQYLEETIHSLLVQSYTTWECILIDDGSTDNTLSIAENYSRNFPEKIRLYINPGKGACAARNHGMEKAQGHIIKFLDSDDALFDKDVLSSQVSFLSKSKADIVFGNEVYYQDIFSDSHIRKQRGKPLNQKNVHTHFFNRFPITSNFLLKISENTELRWSEKLKSGQEFHFLLTAYLKGLHFDYEDKPIAKIRIHNSANRITNKKPAIYATQTNELIKQITHDIHNYKYKNQEFITAFNLWKLRWSYFAHKAKNSSVFKEIQDSLEPISQLAIIDSKQRFLYRINRMNSLLGFLYHEFYLKVLKKNLL